MRKIPFPRWNLPFKTGKNIETSDCTSVLLGAKIIPQCGTNSLSINIYEVYKTLATIEGKNGRNKCARMADNYV
jgi:hypothetical protein